MTRSVSLLLAFFAFSILSMACGPGRSYLSIKHSDGTVTNLTTGSIVYDSQYNYAELLEFGTIYLSPGDSLVVDLRAGGCSSSRWLMRDGVQVAGAQHSWVNWTINVAVPGQYEAFNWENTAAGLSFAITSSSNATGPYFVSINAMLGGALDQQAGSPRMRTDLHDSGLLPSTEPYSALGYSFLGGGGESFTLTANSPSIVDWVIVELRDATQPAVVIASKAALLLGSKRVTEAAMLDSLSEMYPYVSMLEFNVSAGFYYVSIKHRNHLGVTSATPQYLGTSIGAPDVRFDLDETFGTDATHQFQNTVHESKYSLWPGNVNWNQGSLDVKYTGSGNDRDPLLIAIGANPTSTVSGYSIEDVNLDGLVKYTGSANDRDIILQTIGGTDPTDTRDEQAP